MRMKKDLVKNRMAILDKLAKVNTDMLDDNGFDFLDIFRNKDKKVLVSPDISYKTMRWGINRDYLFLYDAHEILYVSLSKSFHPRNFKKLGINVSKKEK